MSSEPHATLEMAIDWFIEAIARGPEPTHQPRRLSPQEKVDAVELIAEINRAIHPRRIPADIEWFWTTWNADSFRAVTPHPQLTGPDFSLSTWLESPEWPRALLWVAYESHCFLAVELDFPDSIGPMLYEDCYASGEGLKLFAPNLSAYFSACAAAIEDQPGVEPWEVFHGYNADDFHGRCSEAVRANGISPSELGPFNWYDLLQCPQRWQVQQGINGDALTLRGATHSIAQLKEARKHGPVDATIVGAMRTTAGSRAGRLVIVEDVTGSTEVWIPTEVPVLGDQTSTFHEIDVTARPLTSSEDSLSNFDEDRAEIQRRALAGDIDGAAAMSLDMSEFIHSSHPVVAVALRPAT